MKEITVFVDCQNDKFYNNADLSAKIGKRFQSAMNNDNEFIVITMDSHEPDEYIKSYEGKKFAIHCVPDTEGYYPINEISEIIENDRRNLDNKLLIIEKNTFVGTQIIAAINLLIAKKILLPEKINIVGSDLEKSILHHVIFMRNYFPNTEIVVDSKLCSSDNKYKNIAKMFEDAGASLL